METSFAVCRGSEWWTHWTQVSNWIARKISAAADSLFTARLSSITIFLSEFLASVIFRRLGSSLLVEWDFFRNLPFLSYRITSAILIVTPVLKFSVTLTQCNFSSRGQEVCVSRWCIVILTVSRHQTDDVSVSCEVKWHLCMDVNDTAVLMRLLQYFFSRRWHHSISQDIHLGPSSTAQSVGLTGTVVLTICHRLHMATWLHLTYMRHTSDQSSETKN